MLYSRDPRVDPCGPRLRLVLRSHDPVQSQINLLDLACRVFSTATKIRSRSTCRAADSMCRFMHLVISWAKASRPAELIYVDVNQEPKPETLHEVKNQPLFAVKESQPNHVPIEEVQTRAKEER